VRTGSEIDADVSYVLAGVRRGFADWRFAEFSPEDAHRSVEFWRSVYPKGRII